jgi:regulator of protease activity HflC (stomatin/prohibitin superfamily)
VSTIELDQLIDELEDVLVQGRRVPFSGRLLIDEEKILDIIDRMRIAVPDELKQARRVIAEQERLIGEARNRVQQTLQEQGLLEAIDAERARLLAQAERDAQVVRNGADEYARNVLEGLQERLTKIQTSVQNGISELQS